MKKTMKTLLALMAGVMTFSACSNEDVLTNETPNPEAKSILSFTAATENNTATRAAIDGLYIKWQTGDAILMMDGTNNSKYNLTSGEGSTSGTFTVDGESTPVTGENIYALYPYSDGSSHIVEEAEAMAAAGTITELNRVKAYINGGQEDMAESYMQAHNISIEDQTIILAYLKNQPIVTPAPALSGTSITNVTIPAVQTVAEGQTVDPKAVLMVAKANGENLSLKNVCSYVKVTPTVACKKIEVRAEGAKLAGTFTVAVSNEPTASDISGGKSVVTLKAAEGDLAAGTYYIAVLPGEKSNGIEVRFYTGDDTFNYNARSTSFEFVRNKVHSGGNNSGATAVRWSQRTSAEFSNGWQNSFSDVKTVTISTGVTGTMPSDAKALNNDNTLWSENDGTGNYVIKTAASKIFATNMLQAFYNLSNMTSITGLDKIDVSESSTFEACFSTCSKVSILNLSTWQITPRASTKIMFINCGGLTSLTLNNTFHAGSNMFTGVGTDSGCTVYGVTGEALKTSLSNPAYTDWYAVKMHFASE